MRTSRLLAALAATAVAGSLTAMPAAEAAAPAPRTLTRHLLSPLSLAIGGDDVYVTQNFAGTLDKLRPGKSPKTVYTAPAGHEVGGVSVRKGQVVFTETASDEQGNPVDSWVKRLTTSGKVRTLAHVRAFEELHNPDSTTAYGVPDLDEECAAQWPADQFGPASYDGLVDSHPYATFQTRRTVYVADAGMNAVLAITNGKVRTVAVTAPVEVAITQEIATAAGFPDCVVGHTYFGESVPTDVEVGPAGKLYVTTEGGGFGEQLPLGSVYRIDPNSGAGTAVATNLMTPTGLAVTPKGDLLVAELFAGRIARIRRGSDEVRPYAAVGLPGAVELHDGDVYATVDVLPPDGGAPDGKVVRFRG